MGRRATTGRPYKSIYPWRYINVDSAPLGRSGDHRSPLQKAFLPVGI
ncbi:MAG: hypothetical protein R3Y53_01115 [Bacillota bacterium]